MIAAIRRSILIKPRIKPLVNILLSSILFKDQGMELIKPPALTPSPVQLITADFKLELPSGTNMRTNSSSGFFGKELGYASTF